MPSRRALLQGGLAGLLAAPLLRGRPARAEGVAKRLLIFFTPNGTVHDRWRPSGSGRSYSLDSEMLSPLAGWEDKLLVLDGLTFDGADNHEPGMAAMLTANGPTSLDQHVAQVIGKESRFSSLELGVQTSNWGGTNQTRMVYRDGSFVTPDDDPESVWKRLFGDLGDEDLLARRNAVLELTAAELETLRGPLESHDEAKLEAHISALGEVQRGLTGGSCEDSVAPAAVSHTVNDAFPDVLSSQIDLAVQALACDMTKVVTLQCSHTVSPSVFTWLGETSGHHTLSHASDDDGETRFAACQSWYASQFAVLLTQLQSQGLLDDTLVLWATELGDARAHVCDDVPWILAGGGGFFDLGQYLSLGETPHDQVLTSLCNAMGLDDVDFAGHGRGALEELR